MLSTRVNISFLDRIRRLLLLGVAAVLVASVVVTTGCKGCSKDTLPPPASEPEVIEAKVSLKAADPEAYMIKEVCPPLQEAMKTCEANPTKKKATGILDALLSVVECVAKSPEGILASKDLGEHLYGDEWTSIKAKLDKNRRNFEVEWGAWCVVYLKSGKTQALPGANPDLGKGSAK